MQAFAARAAAKQTKHNRQTNKSGIRASDMQDSKACWLVQVLRVDTQNQQGLASCCTTQSRTTAACSRATVCTVQHYAWLYWAAETSAFRDGNKHCRRASVPHTH